jgi:hypothetical protein
MKILRAYSWVGQWNQQILTRESIKGTVEGMEEWNFLMRCRLKVWKQGRKKLQASEPMRGGETGTHEIPSLFGDGKQGEWFLLFTLFVSSACVLILFCHRGRRGRRRRRGSAGPTMMEIGRAKLLLCPN